MYTISMKRLVIVSGELSGDTHGARLIDQLLAIKPDLEISGIGGDGMISAGMKAIFHIKEMAFLGLGEIVRQLPFIVHVYRKLITHIKTVRPDAVILIDYPGFNMKIAKAVKKTGIPVIYYISPQLWAWGKNRVKKLKRTVDLMLVLFPFEEEFYKQFGIHAKFTGHPLVDRYHQLVHPKQTSGTNDKVLGILPGSRKQELELLLPDMIKTANILYEQGSISQALVARVSHIDSVHYDPYIEGYPWCRLVSIPMDQLYNQLDIAIVASGTATLETAYFQVPMIIVYRVHPLTWYLGRLFVKLQHIGLANIVAGIILAPEFLQNNFKPEYAASALAGLLIAEENGRARKKMKIIQDKLGTTGASEKAAQAIIEFLSTHND